MKICSMHVKSLLPSMLMLLAASAVFAEPVGSKVTGIYSDMHYNRESGDVGGMEIFVLFSRDGYYVLFQEAQGKPAAPILAKAKIDGNKVEFTLPERSGYSGKFSGVISEKELKGRFEGGQISASGLSVFSLKRRHSYWQNKQETPGSETPGSTAKRRGQV